MATLTLRYIKGDFVVTGPDIKPNRFKTRREAKDWCRAHYPGSPIKEVGPIYKSPRAERGAVNVRLETEHDHCETQKAPESDQRSLASLRGKELRHLKAPYQLPMLDPVPRKGSGWINQRTRQRRPGGREWGQ
jgi:hypothetical protein